MNYSECFVRPLQIVKPKYEAVASSSSKLAHNMDTFDPVCLSVCLCLSLAIPLYWPSHFVSPLDATLNADTRSWWTLIYSRQITQMRPWTGAYKRALFTSSFFFSFSSSSKHVLLICFEWSVGEEVICRTAMSLWSSDSSIGSNYNSYQIIIQIIILI